MVLMEWRALEKKKKNLKETQELYFSDPWL